jgi:multiple sugar transport system substrate-binding protein
MADSPVRRERTSRRTFLVSSAALGAAGALLAACQTAQPPPATAVPKAAAPAPAAAGAPTPTPASAAKPAAGAKPKLTYLHFDQAGLKEVRQSVVADYNQANRVATVEDSIVAHEQLETKRNALIAAGTAPDVFVNQGSSQNIAAIADIVLDLTQYIQRDAKDVQLDQYYPRALDYVKYKGRQVQLPAYTVTMTLAFNKQLFDEAGVKYPTNDWTYDDLVKAGQALTKKDASGKPTQWGVTVDRRSYIEWMNGIWARGGDVFTEDLKKLRINEKFGVETLQWMHDKVNKHKMSPGPGQDIEGGFVGGKYAMDWGAHVNSWAVFRKSGIKWDLVYLPKGPVERGPRTVMDGWQIAKPSKNPEAAWDFVLYAASFEQNKKFADAGFTPARKDVAEATWLKGTAGTRANDPQNIENYFNSMQFARHVQHSKFFLKVTLDMVGPHLDLMFEGKKTVEETANNAAKEANDFLAAQTEV